MLPDDDDRAKRALARFTDVQQPSDLDVETVEMAQLEEFEGIDLPADQSTLEEAFSKAEGKKAAKSRVIIVEDEEE